MNDLRLYATYFGGDKEQELVRDEEAKAIWLRFLPTEEVLPFGCKDDFWEVRRIICNIRAAMHHLNFYATYFRCD